MIEEIVLPKYRVGERAIRNSAETLARYGERALVIGGETALSIALPELIEACADAGVSIAAVENYGGECTYAHMERLSKIGQSTNADMVIGVGGGKALDTAKGCGHKMGLPVVTIPTIAATCAAVTAISVVYNEQGVFVESMFHEQAPACAIIDVDIIAAAPAAYLRAGMGDAVAKHVEASWAARGRELTHTCTLALAISRSCYDPLLRYGADAIRDVGERRVTEAVRQVVLANIVSTGLVSLLIEEVYNGGMAHGLFYGLTKLKDFERKCLHGDAVGYGVLVQLMMDHQDMDFVRVRDFCHKVGMPIKLRETGFELTQEVLDTVVPASLKALKDARRTPYEVTPEMLSEALWAVENAN